MNIKSKQVISIFVSLVILFATIPLTGSSVAAAAELMYEKSTYKEFMDETADGNQLYTQYKDVLPPKPGGIAPPQYITVGGAKRYVNYRLWREQGILCYGNYSNVPDNQKTGSTKGFKNTTQTPGQPVITGKGYYLNNGFNTDFIGERGEYRYHGYDVSGNKLTNLNFQVDSQKTGFDERAWVKDPWNKLPDSYKNKPNNASIYNNVAIGVQPYPDPTVKPAVQNWIASSMKGLGYLTGPNGETPAVPLIGHTYDPEVYRYLYVESAPTLLGLGQGRMWHKSVSDGSIWYQTIAIPKNGEKKNEPVTVVLEPTPETLSSLKYIKNVGPEQADTGITLRFKATATLQDQDAIGDAVKKTVYYTREDVKDWVFTFTGQAPETQYQTRTAAKVDNRGVSTFEYKTSYGYLKSHSTTINGVITFNLNFSASATPNYMDAKQGLTGTGSYNLNGNMVEPPPPSQSKETMFNIASNIPEVAFEGVPFTASDNSDLSQVEYRRVYVDGVEVDDTAFFSGNFVFPGEVGVNGRFAYVDCEYKLKDPSPDMSIATSRDVVYIYPTKPIANFSISSATWMQNRIIKAIDTSNAGNIQLVVQSFPIVEYAWSFGGDTSQLRMGTSTDLSREFLFKQPGIYSLTLRVKNTLGRWSDPYTVEFQVLEDFAPALGVNLSGSVYTRNDTVDAWYYFVGSTDGDVIKSSSLELWYDSDNDGTLDQKLNTWNNPTEFPKYTPARLGYYKYVLKAQEDIVSDTLPQYITDADRKQASYEVEFWVDNYRPLSDLYVNIPIQRPNIDVFMMLDKNLDAAWKDYIQANRVNMSNWLLGKNIIPNISIWDMRTYTYSQPANTSSHTGGSYPSQTISYSSNGYSGTLSLTSTSNNRYSRDNGHYETKTESRYFSASWTNTLYTYWDCNGNKTSQGQTSPAPSSYPINSDGYVGSIPRGSTSQGATSVGYCSSHNPPHKISDVTPYTAYYGGTLTKSVQIWVPNITWYDDYTGYYSGTIYKDVRQPYIDAFNGTSRKYVIYVSNDTISELSDLNMVMGYAPAARLYLAGQPAINTQRENDRSFDVTGKTVNDLMDEILQDISQNSPDVEKFCLLQNESFKMNVGQIDLENDPITETGMQYVHEPGYFDNPTGFEPGAAASYSDTAGWTSTIKNSFANVGKYTIYHRVKDKPSNDPNYASYSYYSAPTSLEVYVVRKPIALATLDWDFDTAEGVYKTRWVDLSYDPDHQYSRPDKGIVDRTIKWRRSGGEWNYGIPDNLVPGTYELDYYVLDPEGYWSDPFVMSFTLEDAPPMQFDAALRTLESRFSLSDIPASEKLEAYELWTRFPGNVRLEMALYNGASAVAPLKTVPSGDSTGTRRGNDIDWNNVTYTIPETLPDRAYDFRITAIGDGGRTATKSFGVNVSTPLGLLPSMPAETASGTDVTVSARTLKYAGTVSATLFYGTSYARSLNLTNIGNAGGSADKAWEGTIAIPGNIPDGTYTARFTAVAPNGSKQSGDLTFRLVSLAITDIKLSGYWNHWRGQVDIFGERLTNEPHRFLSLECVKLDISTIGNPDRVAVRFSPELEAMTYTDPKGNTYRYSDYFGHNVAFPQDSTITVNGNHVYWEYNLPLAPSSKEWNGNRLRPQYSMTVTVYKGGSSVTRTINDIDITGNIFDLTYIQPKD